MVLFIKKDWVALQQQISSCVSHTGGIIELTSILPYFTDYLSVLGFLFTHHETADEDDAKSMSEIC